VARESKTLSIGELDLVKVLKLRILGLAVVEKSRARYKSKITWLRKSDANTKYFHLMANLRKQRNFIHALHSENTLALNQKEKQDVVFENFQKNLSTHVP
jgi:hypothetical protein